MPQVERNASSVNIPRARINPLRLYRELSRDFGEVKLATLRQHAHDAHTSVATMRVVYMELGQHLDYAHGDAWWSQPRLARRLELCPKTVGRALAALHATGLVDKLRGRRAWAVYGAAAPTADKRLLAYRLPSVVSRYELAPRPAAPEPEQSRYKRERAQAAEKRERERQNGVQRSLAHVVCRRAGVTLASVLGRAELPPNAAARKVHQKTDPGSNKPSESLGTNHRPTGQTLNGDDVRKLAGAFLSPGKAARGGAPPRIPPLRR